MGFVADFDAKNNILRVTFEDHLTDAVAFDCSESVKRWAASRPPDHVIVDLSKVTKYDVSPEAIRQLAMNRQSAPTLVVVAPQANAYGMSRMYQLLTEGTRPNQDVVRTDVVRTMDEAYRLLRVKSPEFGPVNWAKTG